MIGDPRFPIFFITGVSFAQSADEQHRWQSTHDGHLAKLMASLASRKKPSPPLPQSVLDYMSFNPFLPI